MILAEGEWERWEGDGKGNGEEEEAKRWEMGLKGEEGKEKGSESGEIDDEGEEEWKGIRIEKGKEWEVGKRTE